jgi:hypothetical protein
MKTAEFINQLRLTANFLQPLAKTTLPGALAFDGTTYIEAEAMTADPSAQTWWLILTTIAALLDAQESPLTPKQIAYLDRLLFGGMGSFNDIWIARDVPGTSGNTINDLLDQQRHALFESFQSLKDPKVS